MRLNLLFILSLLTLSSSCATAIPQWNGHLWAGDSGKVSVSRGQVKQSISCSSPAFDQMVCMSYKDFRDFYSSYVLGCKEWKNGMPMAGDPQGIFSTMHEGDVPPKAQGP